MSNDTVKELARLQRRLEALSETRTDLELQIEDLEEHLRKPSTSTPTRCRPKLSKS